MKYRKSNRAKKISRACKNNGGCSWCKRNRTHCNEKRVQDRVDELRDEL